MDYLSDFLPRAAEAAWWARRSNKRELPFKGPPGWRLLGDGWFSRVYAHRDFPEYAVKVSGPAGFGCGSASRCRPRSDAWPIFAEHCKNNPHKHLPKILHLERMSPRYAWAVMPRYYAMDMALHREIWDRWRSILHGGKDTSEPWLWPIVSMARSLCIEVDLHPANVMQDAEGVLILNDPFSFAD